jgi:N-methylhydantoinase A
VFDDLNRAFDDLVARAADTLASEGVGADEVVINRHLDVKFFSQSRFFTIAVDDGPIVDLDEITKTFQSDMKAAYGYTLPTGYAPVEIVNLRVVAVGLITKPDLPRINGHATLDDARKKTRKVWFRDAGFIDADIYERASLSRGVSFTGPAIVEQPDTTTVMPPDTSCTVDDYGNLIISVGR